MRAAEPQPLSQLLLLVGNTFQETASQSFVSQMYIKSVFPTSTLGLQCLVREFQFFRLNLLAFLLTSPHWGRYSVLYRLFSYLVFFRFLEKQPLAHSGISQVSPVHLHLPRKQISKISGSGVLVLSAVHIAKLAHSSLGQKFCIPPSQMKVSRKVCSSSATYLCSVSRSLFLILFHNFSTSYFSACALLRLISRLQQFVWWK